MRGDEELKCFLLYKARARASSLDLPVLLCGNYPKIYEPVWTIENIPIAIGVLLKQNSLLF